MEKINFERIDEAHRQLIEANANVRKAYCEQLMKFQTENSELRSVLRQCKQMFVAEKGFLVQCSRIEDINRMIDEIDGVLK